MSHDPAPGAKHADRSSGGVQAAFTRNGRTRIYTRVRGCPTDPKRARRGVTFPAQGRSLAPSGAVGTAEPPWTRQYHSVCLLVRDEGAVHASLVVAWHIAAEPHVLDLGEVPDQLLRLTGLHHHAVGVAVA